MFSQNKNVWSKNDIHFSANVIDRWVNFILKYNKTSHNISKQIQA